MNLTPDEQAAKDALVWRYDRLRSWVPDDSGNRHMLSLEKPLTASLELLIDASRRAGAAALPCYRRPEPWDMELSYIPDTCLTPTPLNVRALICPSCTARQQGAQRTMTS